MALRWEDSNNQVLGIPEKREPFFSNIWKRIEAQDPKAIGAMREEICGELQKLMTNEIDFTSVPRYAPGSCESTPRQVIYDVTGDVDESRWWLGLLMMDTAVKCHYDLVAFRSPGEQALRYRPDIRQFLH